MSVGGFVPGQYSERRHADTDRQISSGTLYTLFDQTFKLHLRVLSLPLNED